MLDDDAQVRRVEIGDPEMADQPFAPQLVELLHRVEIGEMREAPPMELQEIDRRDAKAPQAALDAGAHDFRRHRAGRRTPFGEGDGPMRAGGFARGDASQEPSGDQFRAAVVVGHVERVEARSGVFEHAPSKPPPGRASLPSRSMSATCQRPVTMRRDVESGRKRDAIGRVGHRRPSKLERRRRPRYCLAIFAFSALTSSVLISPTVVTLPSVIFHKRNGPVMSPYWSNETGPMTPS